MKRKVGRPPKLSRDQIIEAAVADGIDTFSMSSVARRLEVSHSGLYRYFRDYAALSNAAIESLFVAYPWPSTAGMPWRELLTSVGQAAWGFYEANPGVDRALLASSGQTATAESLLLQWIEELVDQGFSVEDAGLSLNFVLMLAVTTSVNMDAISSAHVQLEDREIHPHLLAVSESMSAHEHGWYNVKVDIFLDGLAQRVQA